MHDSILIERVVQGDREALEALIREHQQPVYGYLRARLLQAADAEDLTQEVFLRFFVARARFDSKQWIRPWLLGIARNLLHEHVRRLRRQKRRQQTAWTEMCLELEDLLGPSPDETADDILGHLPGCLSELGQSAQQAIRMHYAENLRLAEIGERLKRSEGAVKVLVFRARQALKRCLDGRKHLPPPAVTDMTAGSSGELP